MDKPTISVIVPCSPFKHQVRDFLEYFSRTQKAAQTEIILVSWAGYDYRSLATGGFTSVQQVSFARTEPLTTALAQAVKQANAEIVVLTEDHVHYQGPLVDELSLRFQEPSCAAVGSVMMPMDTHSLASLAGYLVSYGMWGPGVKNGFVDFIPPGNTTYRRSALLSLGKDLELLLGARTLLNERLKRDGFKLFLTTDLVSHHASLPTFAEHIFSDFWYGWSFAATRQTIDQWSMMRRLAYAAGIYLKPFVRWWLFLKAWRDSAVFPRGILLKAAPLISLAYFIASVGESLGHLFGHSLSQIKFTEYEIGIDRMIHIEKQS